MSNRFTYELPSARQVMATRFKHPFGWRERVTPWVTDNENGTRFQLSRDEDALVQKLASRISPQTPQHTTALESIGDAIMRRRRGYVCEWDSVVRKEEDWE
jgi:hypothetical protein